MENKTVGENIFPQIHVQKIVRSTFFPPALAVIGLSLSLSKELYIVMICRLHFSNSSMSFNSDSKNGQPFRRPLRSHPARRTGPGGGQHVYFVPYRSSTPSLPLSSSLLSRQSSSGSSITKFRQLLATPPPRLPRANARFKL